MSATGSAASSPPPTALGSTTAYTDLSAVVVSTREPVNTALPVINGSPVLGQTLTATVGAWTGATPFQYSYQWARSNAKGGYDPIPQATQQTYKLTADDVGRPLYMQVKAQNSYGPAWATSQPTAKVTSTPVAAPAWSRSPTIAFPNRLEISNVSFAPSMLRSRDRLPGPLRRHRQPGTSRPRSARLPARPPLRLGQERA